jgi:formylglycine-generating enzyme required for sulfatase activity
MNLVVWYEAFAFCIWDRGRLPTEAEWQYAAQHGDENREYPWGAGVDETRAIYDCTGDGSAADVCSYADILPVGSRQLGDGYWEQSDLAGSMWEWTLDWYTDYPADCIDCANTETATYRIGRGGAWNTGDLRNAYRTFYTPDARAEHIGFRCARDVP